MEKPDSLILVKGITKEQMQANRDDIEFIIGEAKKSGGYLFIPPTVEIQVVTLKPK